MRTELGRYALRYQELLMVALAAILGLTVRRPFVWLVAHHGIDIFLVILVFSTALSIEAISLRRLPALWRPVTLTLVVGITVLPFLSWLASHLVAPGALRDGVVVIGLAPCEIASIATTAMAAGDAALAGGILIGSTALTVALAGPVLTLESPGASLHPWHILVTLVVVVVLPLGAGIALRALRPLPEATLTAASTISTWSLAVLVALVAAEVHLSRHYLPVLLAVLALVAASALLGRAVALTGPPRTRSAVVLTTSMRDFAIAAGIAAVAFGPASAAALGVYGIVVLVWGTGVAGLMRSRTV
jgi:predicted Na+-dependent transporter